MSRVLPYIVISLSVLAIGLASNCPPPVLVVLLIILNSALYVMDRSFDT